MNFKKYRPFLILGGIVLLKWLKEQVMQKPKDVLGKTVKEKIKLFKDKIGPIARMVQAEMGISAEIGMIQAAHESAYGTSGLTQKSNNLFGFTAELGTYWRTQNKPFVTMPTTEWKGGISYKTTRPFRAYESWEESYRDWARLMQTANYAKAGAVNALKTNDLNAFATAMNTAGYATDPAYSAKLLKYKGELTA